MCCSSYLGTGSRSIIASVMAGDFVDTATGAVGLLLLATFRCRVRWMRLCCWSYGGVLPLSLNISLPRRAAQSAISLRRTPNPLVVLPQECDRRANQIRAAPHLAIPKMPPQVGYLHQMVASSIAVSRRFRLDSGDKADGDKVTSKRYEIETSSPAFPHFSALRWAATQMREWVMGNVAGMVSFFLNIVISPMC